MTLVFTICSNNYLAQAITLGQSLINHNPDYTFKICLVDRKIEQINYSAIPYEIIEVESIAIAVFNEMFKRYSITELNTAVKPYFFQYFFKTQSSFENFIYLDPDILVYRAFTELEEKLTTNEIVITPHFTTPINDDKNQAENNFLNSGLYNLGFIALRKGIESEKLVNWWANRLQTKAYVDFTNGIFTDQLWINFAPLFFKKVHILKHPGYNMAYWNMHERLLVPEKQVIFNQLKFSLIFFHFSGYNPQKPDILSKYQNRFSLIERKDVYQLFKNYAKELIDNGYCIYSNYPCYYAEKKKRMDLEKDISFKKSIPYYKRIFRGIVLRFIKIFKINVNYYTQ